MKYRLIITLLMLLFVGSAVNAQTFRDRNNMQLGKVFAELPSHSEYSLTETGRSVMPLLDALDEWGDSIRPLMKKVFGEE